MRINLKMKACCRRSRMMLDESVLYGQSGFQCWQSFCMCVNDAMHRAAPSRVPWWGTANLSCSVRPHSPARSSTKRKVSQRSQFVRLNPAWRRLSNSNPLSLSLPPRPQHQVKGRLGFSGILGDAFPAWASRWGCSRWWRGRGREPLLFLIQSRLVDFFLLFFLFFFFFFFLLLDIVELCVRFVFLPPSTVCLCRWWTFYKDLLVSFLPFFRDSLFLTYPRFLLAVCKQKKMTGSSRNVWFCVQVWLKCPKQRWAGMDVGTFLEVYFCLLVSVLRSLCSTRSLFSSFLTL